MADRIPARLTRSEGRTFGFTVGAAFLVLAAVVWWRAQGAIGAMFSPPASTSARHIGALIFLTLGVFFVTGGVLLPSRLGPVQRAWMLLAHALSRVTTPVFMGVVYFGVIAPIGVGMRFFGRHPLRAHADSGSYWGVKNPRRSELERQF